MGFIVNRKRKVYKPKKENEIKLNSYLKKVIEQPNKIKNGK